MRRSAVVIGGIAAAAARSGCSSSRGSGSPGGDPTMTRSEIVSRAESALGLTYAWGKESWVRTPAPVRAAIARDSPSSAGKCRGPCCIRKKRAPTRPFPPVHQLRVLQVSWTVVRADRPLPARRRRHPGYNTGLAGHVVIYASGDAWNSPIVYEAPGTGQKREGRALLRASTFLGGGTP